MEARIQPNSFVTLDYVLKNDAGETLDDSAGEGGEPIRYVHGYSQLVPGLEARLVGLMAGDKKTIVVPADEAFGLRDEELVFEVDRAEFPEGAQLAAEEEFVAESAEGEEVVLRVLEVKEEAVIVDANHPLAGMTLHYAVDIQLVRPATEEEVREAAEELEAAEEHVHGEGCDHDHSHDGDAGTPLLKLGRKPN